MKSILLFIGLYFSLCAFAEKAPVGQFEVETESGFSVKRTELSIIFEEVTSGELITLSPFRMPENATFEEVVKKVERSEYLSVGEFKLSSVTKKFNLYEGVWERSWLAYSRDFVFLIKNESRKESFPELDSFVQKALSATTWAKP
ncbi:hypothetical protein [Teredinibacter haidensis]|uniref:hypothetical protein n=1 Tax=Teredinibacter haidensis TaxID=2731755 RepID=UPI000948E5AA|nr:hypothetical protein [Teredinibacter haidensis]